ncbi:cysteine peptidase family C39 domain-containing protein [Labilibaculum euxinus]
MFLKDNEQIRIIQNLLKLLKVNISTATIKHTLTNHPNWPSLLSIADAMNTWKFKNAAIKVGEEDLDRIPVPFLSYIGNEDYPIVVTNVNRTTVEFCTSSRNTQSVEISKFITQWSGVCLLIEKTKNSGEVNYLNNQIKYLFQRFIPFILFVMIGVMIFNNILSRSLSVEDSIFFPAIFQVLVFISGIFISIELLKYDLTGEQNLWSKLCALVKNGDCKSVIKLKDSKFMNLLGWSEIGLIYFCAGLFTLIYNQIPINEALSFIFIINIISLPFIIYSLYYQAYLAKKWCFMCLLTLITLLAGGINSFINFSWIKQEYLNSVLAGNITLIYLSTLIIWILIKPYLERFIELFKDNKELLRFKYNQEVFTTLLQQQKTCAMPKIGVGIQLGNENSENTLIIVSNLFCNHCKSAYDQLQKLLIKNDKINVRIIFTSSTNKDSNAFIPTNHILSLMSKYKNQNERLRILNNWYQDTSYNRFSKEFPLKELELNGLKHLDTMSEWWQNQNIQYTPTYFYNGYELPNEYDIENLHYFL